MTEALETRKEYQKKLREERKQQKKKTLKKGLLLTLLLVIAAGILCGTVIASSINTPHDAVEIASANAQYVKDNLQDTAKDTLTGISGFLQKLQQKQTTDSAVDFNNNGASDDDETTDETENHLTEDTNPAIDMPSASENTTGSAITGTVVTEDNPYGIDPTKPMIALTFDDGPSKYTWSIVDTLQQHGARATFFLVGNRVATHQAAIDYTLANNNEIASHTFSHANLVKCTDEELLAQIEKTDAVLQERHDYTPALLRVPYGERNQRVLEAMRQHGKPVIGWSVDPRDWDVQNKEKIVSHILNVVKDGDIILMHDLYQPTADAVAELVPALQERGYQLVTVSELLHYKGIEPVPGTYYYASWKWV